MRRGHLPSIKGVEDGPTTIDLREIPPTVAEVIVLAVLEAFERRAVKTGEAEKWKGGREEASGWRQLEVDQQHLRETSCMMCETSAPISSPHAGRCQVFHSVTFLVPNFDPDYIMWPSHVERISRHFNAQVRRGERSLG